MRLSRANLNQLLEIASTGPRLWNTLPAHLRQSDSLGQFKRFLKTHLFGSWDGGALWHFVRSAVYKSSYLLTYSRENLMQLPASLVTRRTFPSTVRKPSKTDVNLVLKGSISQYFIPKHGYMTKRLLHFLITRSMTGRRSVCSVISALQMCSSIIAKIYNM